MKNRTVLLVLAVALCATYAMGTGFPILSGESTLVTFKPWVYPGTSAETCRAYITYPEDINHSNDTDVVIVAGTGFRASPHTPVDSIDVAVEIVSPKMSETPGLVPVVVKLTNMGNVPALVPRLDVKIDPSGYSDYMENIPVAVGEVEVELTPGAGFSLNVAPNPVPGNILRVGYSLNQARPASVTLFDVTGRVALSRDLAGSRSGQVSLDLGRLSGGVYIVRLDNGRSAKTQKLVIQR